MAKTNLTLTAADRSRYRAARRRGKAQAQNPTTPVDERYDRKSEAVILTFQSGASMTIPRCLVPGLVCQPAKALEAMVLSPAGDALRWPSLDVDVHVAGLVQRAFGSLMNFV